MYPEAEQSSPFGSTVSVESVKSCVVYSADTGEIHHTHLVVTLEGGRTPDQDEVAQDAMRSYTSQAKATSGELHVLHVAPDDMEPGTRYRVDHANRSLIAEQSH